jgi:hypothetical protein
MRELRGISIQQFADGSFTITTPSKYVGVYHVLEVDRNDGSAWHLFGSIFDDVGSQHAWVRATACLEALANESFAQGVAGGAAAQKHRAAA